MTDAVQDRSIKVGRDAVNSVITSGDGNVVNVYYQVSAEVVAAAAPEDFGANPYGTDRLTSPSHRGPSPTQ